MADRRTISIGPLIGAVGAALLFVSLFLEWYESFGDEATFTAFTVFEVLDLVLALLAVAAFLAFVEALGVRLPGRGAPSRPRLALPLGAAALFIVLTQLVNDPPAVVGSDRSPEIGLWLGLAGSLLVVAGGLLSLARISLALVFEERERRHPGEPAPTDSEAPTSQVPPVEPGATATSERPERPS